MTSILSDAKKVLDEWFEDLWAWRNYSEPRKIAVWIKLEEVPLNLWHLGFFSFLGNQWGTFIKMDDISYFKKRFHYTRILVLVGSKAVIPHFVNVKAKGYFFRILVSVEDSASLLLDDDIFREQFGRENGTGKTNFNQWKTIACSQVKSVSSDATDLDPFIGKFSDSNLDTFSMPLSLQEQVGWADLLTVHDRYGQDNLNPILALEGSQLEDMRSVDGPESSTGMSLNEFKVGVGSDFEEDGLGSTEGTIVPLSFCGSGVDKKTV
ncbi:hypothetical protein DITRI_Ditri17bG0135100 [Diplodiscus trichospermus]